MDDFTRLFDNDPALLRCPFPAYARMRAEAPVWVDPASGVYVISRYSEQLDILDDASTFSPGRVAGPGTGPVPGTRLRQLAGEAFSPDVVRELEPFITTRCAELANRVRPGEPVDLVRDFAEPLAIEVIAEALCVPGSDYAFFRWCCRCVLELGNGGAVTEDHVTALADFSVFFRRRFEQLRARPDNRPLARLLASGDVPDEELVELCLTVIVSGTESTANLLASVILRLATDRDLLAVCQMCPPTVGVAIEELVRLESPVQGFYRTARTDTEIGGAGIAAGTNLLLLFGSGNRDEDVFSEPDTFRLRRLPERAHLGFGHGENYCPGAVLARAEVRIAVETLIGRFGGIELCERADRIRYRGDVINRGPAGLPVRFCALPG